MDVGVIRQPTERPPRHLGGLSVGWRRSKVVGRSVYAQIQSPIKGLLFAYFLTEASATHFLTEEDLAAPERALPFLSTALVSQAA